MIFLEALFDGIQMLKLSKTINETQKRNFSGLLTAHENIDFEYISSIFFKKNRFILKYFSFFLKKIGREAAYVFFEDFFLKFFSAAKRPFFLKFSQNL